MSSQPDHRRATRIICNLPVLIQPIGQPSMKLHDAIAKVYERVPANQDRIGERIPATIRDLSTNGAFFAGPALPLLSRVAFTFALEDHGQVDAVGWTLWRRNSDCEVPRDSGPATLPQGFGVLFEAIPIDARITIHKLVQRMAEGVS